MQAETKVSCPYRVRHFSFRITEIYLLLSVNIWPTPSNDGTCEVNIEYELENTKLALHDVVISIPLPYVEHF